MNWKTALKACLSVLILYLVIRSIDTRHLLEVFRRVNPAWLAWAAGWFVFSKILGAFRYNDLLKTDHIRLKDRQQLQLYWLGMYYNLLLPGGISGDGYKIKVLMDAFKRPFRRLFSITLYDRISGVIALAQLALLLALAIAQLQAWSGLLAGIFVLSIPASKILFDRMIGAGSRIWAHTSLQSLGVQLTQSIAILGIIFALRQPEQWLGYSLVFLVSSVVAMLPFTIGGAGARELTFLWGARILDLNAEHAVAIAFIFYLVSTAVALYGMRYSFSQIIPSIGNHTS